MVDPDAIQKARRQALEEMLATSPNDTFALYGLALEYKAQGALEEACQNLRRTIGLEPTHLYAYYQLGEILISMGDDDAAQDILSRGANAARDMGDAKALGEMNALLDMI